MRKGGLRCTETQPNFKRKFKIYRDTTNFKRKFEIYRDTSE